MSTPNPNPENRQINIIDPAFTLNPQPVYDEVLTRYRVAKTIGLNSPVISRYEDVIWALRHPEIFSSEMDMHVGLGTERPMIPQQLDPPLQTRYRKILDLQFSRARVMEIEPDVRRHANELIDQFVDAGECEFDRDFAIPLPCRAFLRMMGLPQEDLELFLELKNGIIRPPIANPYDIAAAKEYRAKTGKRIYAYFEALIDDREKSPRDDMMTYFTKVELDGKKLTRNEILDICFLFLLGGLDTVTATLGCSVFYLAENPEHRRRLAEDPSLVPAAVEELLRWQTPVTIVPRILKQDWELDGVQMKAGSMVSLLIGAANVDEQEFGAGEGKCVHFERERNRHIAFGAGPHRCLGSHLARMELRVGLEEWHRRIPSYSIKAGETPRVSPGIREVMYLPLVWEKGGAA
ncbi:MAG: cytochrome P450 [Deltaproteobacteria bacterium]|nr:cytochrome P450 [Deltaproteobacteria bacterium]